MSHTQLPPASPEVGTDLGMPRVNICTCFLLSSSRFSSGVGRVKFPFADSSFSAAELLLGLDIS